MCVLRSSPGAGQAARGGARALAPMVTPGAKSRRAHAPMRRVRLAGRVAAAGVVAAKGQGCIVCGWLRAARRLQPHVLRLATCGP